MSKPNKNQRDSERIVVNIAKSLSALTIIFWMGFCRISWSNKSLYTHHFLPMLMTFFVLAYDWAYLYWFSRIFPNVLTPWRVGQMIEAHWLFHLILLVLGFNTLSVIVWGIKPWKEKKAFQAAIDDLGLVTSTGKRPRVLSIADAKKGKKIVNIMSVGVGPEQYEKRFDDLQSSIDWRIDNISRDEKNRFVKIFLTEGALPEQVDYSALEEKINRSYQFVVGESSSGTILTAIDDLPHLLIAGVTGGGKSTFLNAMLVSLLKSPRLSIYGIDLKVVELKPYADIPGIHIDDTLEDAARTLTNVHREMERRYRDVLGAQGKRKMEPKRDNLNRIVVVVDECSDLYGKAERGSDDYKLTTKCRELTNAIARKGRAAGIHLVLATQRVSANTLDSRILGNIPARVCFQMSSVPNSVLVLNNKCAYELDKIPGRGYWSSGTQLVQIQAPYIEEEDIEKRLAIIRFERKEKIACEKVKNSLESFHF